MSSYLGLELLRHGDRLDLRLVPLHLLRCHGGDGGDQGSPIDPDGAASDSHVVGGGCVSALSVLPSIGRGERSRSQLLLS